MRGVAYAVSSVLIFAFVGLLAVEIVGLSKFGPTFIPRTIFDPSGAFIDTVPAYAAANLVLIGPFVLCWALAVRDRKPVSSVLAALAAVGAFLSNLLVMPA